MQTSGTGISTNHKTCLSRFVHFADSASYRTSHGLMRGFSLLELLVVIFIIGMIMTFASLSVGGGADKAVEQETKRLTALLRLASEEAIMNSRDMVLQLSKASYSFGTLGADGQLAPMDSEDTLFRPRELPDDIFFKAAEINGESAKLSLSPEEDEEPPTVFIMSSGEVIPFSLQLTRDDGPIYELVGEFTGKFSYERLDER